MLLKKIAVCKIKWKQLKRDKISAKKSNFLFLNQILYMMELKSAPPTNLRFWAPALTYLQNRPNASQKNSCVQDKVETVEKWQNQCKKIKFFIFKSNSLYDGAKKWPPNLGFWAPALTFLQIRTNASQKNSCAQDKVETVEKRQNQCKKSNFLFLNQIFYMMELKSDPQPRFLSSCSHLPSS